MRNLFHKSLKGLNICFFQVVFLYATYLRNSFHKNLKRVQYLLFAKLLHPRKGQAAVLFFSLHDRFVHTLKNKYAKYEYPVQQKSFLQISIFFCRHGLYPTTSNLKGFHGILYQRVFFLKSYSDLPNSRTAVLFYHFTIVFPHP